jgi:uncharacterized protein
LRAPRGPRLARLFTAYVALAERRAGLLLLALFGLMLAALALAVRLELHADVSELLPDRHPAVVALRGIAGRQKAASNLVLLIHGPDAAATRRFAEALRPELAGMVPGLFSEIQWRPSRDVPDHARKWKWLYADVKDLEHFEELLDRVIATRAQPAFVDLDGDAEEQLRAERARMNQNLPAEPPDGRYFEAVIGGDHWLGILLWRRLEGLATRGDRDTFAAVERLVASIDPRRFGVKVEYTGPIAQAIDEQNGIRDDLTLATVLCAVCVLAAVYGYFRRAALLWVIGAPAVLGLLLSLSVASVTIHWLNINTAFLVSIILGNGINSPIILLGRYGEERQAGRPVAAALAHAMTGSVAGVGAAVAAASIAYGSLAWTSFRGFNQFGLLGGTGMVLVGLMTFILVPPMVIFGERRWPGSLTPRPNVWRAGFARLGEASARRPRALALAALVLLAALASPLRQFAADPIEWNFENIRTEETPSQRLWPHMRALGMGEVAAGYVGNNGVLLVDEPGQADAVAEALKAQDSARGARHVLKEVRTLNSMLPKEQAAKLGVLARIRKKIDRHFDLLSAEEKRDAGDWRPPDYLRPLTIEDLPPLVQDAFTEVDGRRGRLVGVDADYSSYNDWNGHDLLRMSDALTVDALGRRWVAASTATIFAGMLSTILDDGPRVTIAAFAGVTLLMLLVFGARGAAPVLISIAVGALWLGGASGLWRLKLNFMNYAALPITLGVGADYAANIWARLKREGVGRVREVIAETGSAVALCSLTTVIGYSSLLLSHNRALRSFGLLADLGEICCLTAALLVLPALVRIFGRAPEGGQ